MDVRRFLIITVIITTSYRHRYHYIYRYWCCSRVANCDFSEFQYLSTLNAWCFGLPAGLTAFDFISDFEEWIECCYFSEEIKARLKGLSARIHYFIPVGDFPDVKFLIISVHIWPVVHCVITSFDEKLCQKLDISQQSAAWKVFVQYVRATLSAPLRTSERPIHQASH